MTVDRIFLKMWQQLIEALYLFDFDVPFFNILYSSLTADCYLWHSFKQKAIRDDYKCNILLRRIPNEAVKAHLRPCPLPQSISVPGCHLQPWDSPFFTCLPPLFSMSANNTDPDEVAVGGNVYHQISCVISGICDASHREGYQCNPSHHWFLQVRGFAHSQHKGYLERKSLSCCGKFLFQTVVQYTVTFFCG